MSTSTTATMKNASHTCVEMLLNAKMLPMIIYTYRVNGRWRQARQHEPQLLSLEQPHDERHVQQQAHRQGHKLPRRPLVLERGLPPKHLVGLDEHKGEP